MARSIPKRVVWLAVALLAPVCLSVEAFQPQKPTAVLAGTLLSDDGIPVDRAIVSMVGPDRPGVRFAITNASGEFSIDGLPAGSFTVWAAKAGFLTSYYGSKEPGRGPATPVALANGKRVTVAMTMLRGAGIGGRITAPGGQPMPQVAVQVRPVSSRDTAAPQTSRTDGDGRYLIFGLAPGEYIVEALAPQTEGSALAFAPTFFPSVALIDQAVTIAVKAGERRDDVAFNLYRAARVSGKVVVPNGQPMSGVTVAIGLSHVPVSETGEFTVRGVIPGTYALWARWDATGSLSPAGADARTLWGEGNVVVDGPDVSGVVLNLHAGARVTGTIRVDAAAGTPAMDTLKFTLSPQASSTAAFAGTFSAKADSSGNVVFPSVPPGPYDLRTASGTWVITSAMAAGQDVADGPLDIRPGAATSSVAITLTETEISGTVLDANQPTSKFPLVFFSVDQKLWTPRSRRVRTVQPGVDGTFRVGGLPPGDYFVVAYPNIDFDAPVEAADLKQFAGVAGRFNIASGEKRRVDVTLANPPDSGAVSGGRADFSGIWTPAQVPNSTVEGCGNCPAGQLHVGPGTGRLVISQRGDKLRIESYVAVHGPRQNAVEYVSNGEPVRNPFFLGPTLPASPIVQSEITSWRQGDSLVSTIDVFLPGESVPRHYVETLSISPEGILAWRIERVGFPDTRTQFYRKTKS